jgi:Ca2+-binding RTX toxin-like protein
MRRRLVMAAVVVVALVTGPFIGTPPASALSAGCTQFNHPGYDTAYTSGSTAPVAFSAGEQIVATAGAIVSGPLPTTVTFEVPVGVVVDTAAYPGTVTYTFLADTVTQLAFFVQSPALVEWEVSCAAVSPGCAALNSSAFFDGLYQNSSTGGPVSFLAGEQITISGVPEFAPGNEIQLFVSPSVTPVASAVLPGTMTYTFPADATGTVSWNTTGGNATWDVQCRGVVADPSCTIIGAGDLLGTPFDDVLCGSNGVDRIYGMGGNDTIYGLDGADRINGGAGNDTLYGQGGADQLAGDDGDDHLVGGAGGPDRLVGGAGNDLLDAVDAAGGDYLVGGTQTTVDTCLFDQGDAFAQCESI